VGTLALLLKADGQPALEATESLTTKQMLFVKGRPKIPVEASLPDRLGPVGVGSHPSET